MKRGNEPVGFIESVVEGKGCSYCALNAESLHQRLCAMVARTHGYAEFVKQHTCVVMVGFTYEE